jgi:hypothetical protein
VQSAQSTRRIGRGGRREQRAREGLIDGQSLLAEMGIAEPPVGALDAVLHEGGAPQVAPEVRRRQFPTQEQCLDDRGDGGPAHRVDPRAGAAQPAAKYSTRVHAVLR